MKIGLQMRPVLLLQKIVDRLTNEQTSLNWRSGGIMICYADKFKNNLSVFNTFPYRILVILPIYIIGFVEVPERE